MSLGLVVALFVVLQLIIGTVFGLIVVRFGSEVYGVRPEQRLKKIGHFLAGFFCWPWILFEVCIAYLGI